MQPHGDDAFDLRSLLEPASEQTPAGRELDGTLELDAFENACREPEEPGIEGVEASDERNWRDIERLARGLLRESKDVRVAVALTRALLHVHGLQGLCEGISFVSALVERYWAQLHPLEEDSDPTARLNALNELASPPVLARLRVTQIVSARAVGTFHLNDILVAGSSPLGRANATQADPRHVLAALTELGEAGLRERLALSQAACTHLQNLTEFVAARTGHYLRLGALTGGRGERASGLLDGLSQILSRQHAQSVPESAAEPTSSSLEASLSEPRVVSASDGKITRRDDVVLMLERICDYYARSEPSSPVPLLLQRAKRLATMDFLSIIRDLADQGLPQVATIAGIQSEEDE